MKCLQNKLNPNTKSFVPVTSLTSNIRSDGHVHGHFLNPFADVFTPQSNMFPGLRNTAGVLNPWAETFIPLSQKSYHDHFDKISSAEISFITHLNPNAKIFIPRHSCNSSKATSASRNLNDQINHDNFAENSMLNLSPTANNLVTPVLSTFSDDYRENVSCNSTDSTSCYDHK